MRQTRSNFSFAKQRKVFPSADMVYLSDKLIQFSLSSFLFYFILFLGMQNLTSFSGHVLVPSYFFLKKVPSHLER